MQCLLIVKLTAIMFPMLSDVLTSVNNYLEQNEFKESVKLFNLIIESEVNNGYTSLHFASLYGHLSIVQYLISQGANIESEVNNRYTPLHFASLYGHLSIVQYLISQGANIESKTNQGVTPLHYCLLV